MKKKIISVLLCIAMCVTLIVGCGSSEKSTEESTEKSTEESTEKSTEESEEELVLRVSVGTANNPYSPYGRLDENEKPEGFVVDVWNEIAKRVGCTVEFEYMGGTDAHYGALDAGKTEVMGLQLEITPAIEDKYNFTIPYGYNEIRMVCLKDKPYETLADLAGQKVCVAPGKLTEFFEGYNAENPDKPVELVTTEGNIYEELDLGRFEAFPMTIISFEKQQRDGQADAYKMFGETVISEENVFAMGKDVPEEVLDKVNEAIQEMKDDGAMTEISEKWFCRDITKPFSQE